MNTKIIGLKEFRQNLSAYTKQVQSKKMRLIVLNKNIPLIEVKPVEEKEFILENLREEVAEARAEVKRGEVYTLDEIEKMLGL